MSLTACEPIGIVVGVASEAARLRGCRLPHLVAASGANAGRAERAARDLVARGVGSLVGFGLAGGLRRDLAPGAAVIPAWVILEDGDRVPVDPVWGAALGARDAILAVDHVVNSPDEKRRLARETGAAAVDMESGAVARVAREFGLPFVILRAVADSADRALPRVLDGAIAPDGRTRVARLLLQLVRNPGQIAGTARLSLDSAAGLSTLGALARGLSPPPARPTGTVPAFG